jgi:hypothetical protein
VLRIPLGREKRWFTHVGYFGIMSQAKEHDFSKQFIDSGLHYFIITESSGPATVERFPPEYKAE